MITAKKLCGCPHALIHITVIIILTGIASLRIVEADIRIFEEPVKGFFCFFKRFLCKVRQERRIYS